MWTISIAGIAFSILALCESLFFFFNDTATTEIYTLSLHDALPILPAPRSLVATLSWISNICRLACTWLSRSEEHTSELQSHSDLVCRLLLEKKKLLVEVKSLVII